MDFVNRLKPEHLQSFWSAPSHYNFAIVATFIVLLWSTAPTPEEATFYREKLEEYRWTLRVSSKAVSVLDRAIDLVTASTGNLVKLIQDKREASYPAESPDESDQVGSYQGDGQGISDEHSVGTPFGGEPFDVFLGNGWTDPSYGAEEFDSEFSGSVTTHNYMPMGLPFTERG